MKSGRSILIRMANDLENDLENSEQLLVTNNPKSVSPET